MGPTVIGSSYRPYQPRGGGGGESSGNGILARRRARNQAILSANIDQTLTDNPLLYIADKADGSEESRRQLNRELRRSGYRFRERQDLIQRAREYKANPDNYDANTQFALATQDAAKRQSADQDAIIAQEHADLVRREEQLFRAASMGETQRYHEQAEAIPRRSNAQAQNVAYSGVPPFAQSGQLPQVNPSTQQPMPKEEAIGQQEHTARARIDRFYKSADGAPLYMNTADFTAGIAGSVYGEARDEGTFDKDDWIDGIRSAALFDAASTGNTARLDGDLISQYLTFAEQRYLEQNGISNAPLLRAEVRAGNVHIMVGDWPLPDDEGNPVQFPMHELVELSPDDDGTIDGTTGRGEAGLNRLRRVLATQYHTDGQQGGETLPPTGDTVLSDAPAPREPTGPAPAPREPVVEQRIVSFSRELERARSAYDPRQYRRAAQGVARDLERERRTPAESAWARDTVIRSYSDMFYNGDPTPYMIIGALTQNREMLAAGQAMFATRVDPEMRRAEIQKTLGEAEKAFADAEESRANANRTTVETGYIPALSNAEIRHLLSQSGLNDATAQKEYMNSITALRDLQQDRMTLQVDALKQAFAATESLPRIEQREARASVLAELLNIHQRALAMSEDLDEDGILKLFEDAYSSYSAERTGLLNRQATITQEAAVDDTAAREIVRQLIATPVP